MPVYNRIQQVLDEINSKAPTKEDRLSKKALADYVGVNPPAVSRWLGNTSQPSIEMLFKIAEFLQRDPGDLLIKTKA